MVTPDVRDGPLGPLRRPRLPRPVTALRVALVAALLATAAGVLYAREPVASCPAAVPGASPVPDGGRRPLPAGSVGLPVRLAEPAALAVVRPGDRVDLLALPGAGSRAPVEPLVVAAGALVLAVPGVEAAGGAAIYLAMKPEAARRTSIMPENTRFGVIVQTG
ncbi:flagellar biosynthesis protein FlgA [Micromonospora sp. NPDC049679]|uniref:flagellar biosynthesis protein FlgA n=1 Tax=Micromonospora sp. NPDC049679 TaxID=3155920 RepID=UPI00340F41DB